MKINLGKLRRSPIRRKVERIQFYVRNIVRDSLPQSLFRKQLNPFLTHIASLVDENFIRRLNYYNKLSGRILENRYEATIGTIPLKHSLYYYDLKEHARYFQRDYGLNYEFGDVIRVPQIPTFVKSRPISGDNTNSLLMKLDKFRHFYMPHDPVPFEDKKPLAVWRGGGWNPRRMALVEQFANHPLCDVGIVSGARSDGKHKPFMSIREHMQYRYIISIEGNDVATNLKWIMASNSVCMQPRSVYETWFMEGRLVPGLHYVELRDDFADLDEKILYFEKHPDEAGEIVKNAHRHVSQFLDRQNEQALSILALHKYFVATGQMEPHPAVADFLWPRLTD